MQLDMKTLYEQITMYFKKENTYIGLHDFVEVYHQLGTPIYAQVFFIKDNAKITSISFVVK